MEGFVDEATIEVKSGDGGNGAVSFRREKYVPRGGPDGGDGGKGGDVIFTIKKNVKTLSHLKQRRAHRAQNGAPGGSRQKHGKDGSDVEIFVPPGTIIRDSDTGEVIKDFQSSSESWIFLRGGLGGRGNRVFATATRQAPRFSTPGKPGQERLIHVELNIIADVGIVGLPNAGKSTLLSRLSNAHPKIDRYPFTTKSPNLGVLKIYDRDIIIADIPGIIKGASGGAGLGFSFLKHITRTNLLLFLIDLSQESCPQAFPTLMQELKSFQPKLMCKKRFIVGNKLDLDGTEENLAALQKGYPEETVLGISAHTGRGLPELKGLVAALTT